MHGVQLLCKYLLLYSAVARHADGIVNFPQVNHGVNTVVDSAAEHANACLPYAQGQASKQQYRLQVASRLAVDMHFAMASGHLPYVWCSLTRCTGSLVRLLPAPEAGKLDEASAQSD